MVLVMLRVKDGSRGILLALAAVSVVMVIGLPGAASGRGASAKCLSGQHPVGAQICAAGGSRAVRIVATVRRLQRRYALQAVIFGAWRGRNEVVSGALGTALPGVPATRAMYFRIGNTTEAFETTLLMQLVDRGKIRLDDELSRWYPRLPLADKITVGMLASTTSGYADYVNVASFQDAFHANVFGSWTPDQLIKIGTSQPMLFPPGTNWSFSDTNFVLLGEILRRVGGMPVSEQIRRRILIQLKLRSTRMTTTAAVPSPTLHGYTNERGPWEDATFWNPSWATYTGDMTSTLSDLRTWASAVGTGSLLSKRSHARQIAPKTVGLAAFTKKFYYGLGVAVANKWVLGGAPGLLGYTGMVAYFPSTKTTVVVLTTTGRDSPPGIQYAGAIFDAVGKILAPGSPPTYPAGLRGGGSG
jgi:D-alanyl-D-alanine carboxypeptidase